MRPSLSTVGAATFTLAARVIIVAAILATLVIGLVLVVTGAADVHTVATVIAAVLRSSWG
jgi:hypothetical protein